MGKNKGWICLYRSIEECVIWDTNEPYDRRSAWIDLLLMANHEDKKIMFDGEVVTVKRGETITSVRKLSSKWSWSKDRVLKFLRALEKHQMIHRDSNKRRTLVSIVNYSVYQDMQDTDSYTDTYTGSYTDSPQTTIKQLNNSNNIYSRVVNCLNERAGTNYRATSAKTQKSIKARLNEGFAFEDFERVIDNKCNEWIGTDMQKYLRPETLFGNKFESYLNQKSKIRTQQRTVVIDGVAHTFTPDVTWLQMERNCPDDCIVTSDNPEGSDCYYKQK